MENKNIAYCLICDKDTEYIIKTTKDKRTIKGVEVVIEAKHAYCKECGEYIFIYDIERENQILAFDEYKKSCGLLTSKEIVAIRKKYHLSQTKLAKAIKCGEKNIARYENGSIQDESIDLLIRLLDKMPQSFGVEVDEELIMMNQKQIEIINYYSSNSNYYFDDDSFYQGGQKEDKLLCQA